MSRWILALSLFSLHVIRGVECIIGDFPIVNEILNELLSDEPDTTTTPSINKELMCAAIGGSTYTMGTCIAGYIPFTVFSYDDAVRLCKRRGRDTYAGSLVSSAFTDAQYREALTVKNQKFSFFLREGPVDEDSHQCASVVVSDCDGNENYHDFEIDRNQTLYCGRSNPSPYILCEISFD